MTRFKVVCIETVKTELLVDVKSSEKDPAALLDEWLESDTVADVVSTRLTAQEVQDRDFIVAQVPKGNDYDESGMEEFAGIGEFDRRAEPDAVISDKRCSYVVEEPPEDVMNRRTVSVEDWTEEES